MTNQEHIEIINIYKTQGLLDPRTYRRFDQEGNWILGEGGTYWDGLDQVFREAKLPQEKILEKDPEGGLHLKTSFKKSYYSVAGHNPAIKLDYTTIEGNLHICNKGSLSLPNLKKIKGDFNASLMEVISAPLLREIGGSLMAKDAKKISLPQLVRIGEAINIPLFLDNDPKEARKLLNQIDLPCLRRLKSPYSRARRVIENLVETKERLSNIMQRGLVLD